MERVSNFGRENVSTSFFSESVFESELNQSSIYKISNQQQSGINMEVINNLLNQINAEHQEQDNHESTNILALISSSFPSGFGDSINISQEINEDKMRVHLFVASTPLSVMKQIKQNKVKSIIDHENVSQYIKDDRNKSFALKFNGASASPIYNKSRQQKHKIIGRKLYLNEVDESFNKTGLLN